MDKNSLFDKLKNIGVGLAACIIWVTIWNYIAGKVGYYGFPISHSEYGNVKIFSCLFIAPWVEELVFRLAPINLVLKIDEKYLWPVIIISSAVFGWAHGGQLSVVLQGFMGVVFSLVYIKSGYWSAVTLHFSWNLFCILYL